MLLYPDHLNTPRLVADATGTTVWRWDQAEPFGVNVPDENPSGLGAFDLPLRLPGQYFDKETNNHYNYFRDYDPSLGIYKQSDPIGLEAGLNTYAYAQGNPLAFSDPSGEYTVLRYILTGAMTACMKNARCRKAVEEAKKVCTEVECAWKRERADHKFPNGKFCEHYRLTCYKKGQKNSPPIFEWQWAFPGRCFDKKQDEMSE